MSVEKFSNILGYSELPNFFDRYANFVNRSYQELVSFYSGKSLRLNKASIINLRSLIEESELISSLISSKVELLSYDLSCWEIIDMFEEIKTRLQTIMNTPKWLRSSFDIDFSNKQITEEFLKSSQQIEDLVSQLGSTNPNNDWVSVSVNNNMFEENYTYKGEMSVNVRVQYLVGTTPVNSIDIMVGDNVLGKDINREIKFIEDDLLSLPPQETLIQSAEIILSAYKGGIPEFPNLGVAKEQVSSNVNSLQFPSIFRQLTEMFAQDDSFLSTELIDTSIDQDAFFMKLLIVSRTGSTTEQTFRIFDDTFDNTFN